MDSQKIKSGKNLDKYIINRLLNIIRVRSWDIAENKDRNYILQNIKEDLEFLVDDYDKRVNLINSRK